MYLNVNKVYRFDYTDRNGVNHGRRTCLMIDNCKQTPDHVSHGVLFLDLEKNAPRNFVPRQMSNIEEVPAVVVELNTVGWESSMVDGVVKLHKEQGYDVFHYDGGYNRRFVKGWKPKDIRVEVVYNHGFTIRDNTNRPIHGIHLSRTSGKLETWNENTKNWHSRPTNRETLQAFVDEISTYLKTV